MAQHVYYTYWLVSCLGWLLGTSAGAVPCIRLTGIVRDYASRQPLMAQLYLKTPTGRVKLSKSTDNGQFSVDIACSATSLVIEKAGYRPQSLPLNMASLSVGKAQVWVIIPLIAVDQRGNDRPYAQTEQTYFVQANASEQANTRPQHNTFTISDALTGTAVPAQTCFIFTRSGQKRCLVADAVGKLSIDFTEADIVAFEVTSPGYQTYEGNYTIEKADGRQLQHTIRLTRQLTVLSIMLGGELSSCELQAITGSKTIVPEQVPDKSNVLVAYDLQPQRYTLTVFNREHGIQEQRAVTLRTGLNVIDVVVPKSVASEKKTPRPTTLVAVTPVITPAVEPLERLDSLPLLYFEQGDYKLRPSSEKALVQLAAYLSQHPKVKIELVGHTDKEGDERLNRTLAEQRAKVVSTFLYRRGVADNRMLITGCGSQFPIAPSDIEENKAKNRRVAMKLIAN